MVVATTDGLMRTLQVLAAACALPLSAIAQTAPDRVQSTEVSELVVQARKVTEVSGLTVEGGCRPPAKDPRWPSEVFDAPSNAKKKRTEESKGTRAFILREIADVTNGATPDYAHMGPVLAWAVRTQLPLTKVWIKCRGVFKDIKFLHVSQQGNDDFEVDFSNGAIEWDVRPFDSHGVTQQSALRHFYPQPVSRLFDDLLKSMEGGRPKYADLTPDAAAAVEAQWPQLQKAFKGWLGAHSIYFLRQEDDGSYTYKVVYGDHPVVWKVAPLDGAGKITGIKFDDDA
jgi:hypothetical protein